MTAQALAARNRLTYQDAGSFVLLADGASRIRLYPGSNRISVDGMEMVLKSRVVRDGRTVMVPGPAVGLIESTLASGRGSRVVAVVPMPEDPAPAPVPLRTLPIAAAAPSAAPSSAVADPRWTPLAPTERSWRWIVLHHSDDRSGCAAKYHRQHLAQGWEHGLGYHFVIGNGTESGDGQVEVGQRWSGQIHGAHAKTPDNCFNEQGVGVCLVGDFEHGTGRPTRSQMDALVRLCRWLMERYSIPAERVVGHSDCKATDCPGKNFPWAELRRRLATGS
jgi:hypothetical protein